LDSLSLTADKGFALHMSVHGAGGNGSTSRAPAVPQHRGTHWGWRRGGEGDRVLCGGVWSMFSSEGGAKGKVKQKREGVETIPTMEKLTYLC